MTILRGGLSIYNIDPFRFTLNSKRKTRNNHYCPGSSLINQIHVLQKTCQASPGYFLDTTLKSAILWEKAAIYELFILTQIIKPTEQTA